MSDATSENTEKSAEQVNAAAVTFPFDDQERAAYYARPEGDGPFPAVVVIHEIYGLNENIKDIARRFAGLGYAALAVDIFAGRNRVVCMARLIGQMINGNPTNPTTAELKASLDWLAAKPEVNGAKVGAIGFCMGGTFAIAWACVDDRLQVIAPFYARNPRPIAATKRLCPVVGSYPEKDFTTSAGRQLDEYLDTTEIKHDIKVYPGAKHSFFNDQGPAYDAAASADAWRRIIAYFSEQLG